MGCCLFIIFLLGILTLYLLGGFSETAILIIALVILLIAEDE